jgi:hypothetical protein
MVSFPHPKFFAPLALVASLGVLFLLSSIIYHPSRAQSARNSDSNVVPQVAPTPCLTCGGSDDKPHTLAAAYYSINDGLTATLMLNNKGPKPLEVKPTLFSLDGQQFELPTVIIEGTESGASFREIDMNEFVAAAGPGFREGSLQLFHLGKDLVLGAQIKLVDLSRSLLFEEKLLEIPTEIGQRRLEAVWWLPSHKGEVKLVMSNTSDEDLPVTATIDGSAPKQKDPFTLTLAPHETRIVDARHDVIARRGGRLAQIGGITLEHNGGAGALLARVLMQDAAVGYAMSARFYDPQKGKSTKLHGAGLRLGEIDGEHLTPMIVARNVGDAPTTVTGRVPYTKADGSVETTMLPELRLAPGETKLVDTKVLKQSKLGNEGAAGLEFEYEGKPGEIIMLTQSVVKDGDYAFAVPMWDIGAQRSSSGGFPWKTEGTTSTMLYFKNVTDHRQQFIVELLFDGSRVGYATGIKTAEAGQTIVIDIAKLRDEQVPDANGRTIPLEATRGHIRWGTRSVDALPMIGRSEQVDLTNRISSSYACAQCCPPDYQSVGMNPGQTEIPIAGRFGFQPMEVAVGCYTIWNPYPVSNASWNSSDTGVAQMVGDGIVEGMSAGMSQIVAEWPLVRTIQDGGTTCMQYMEPAYAEAPVEVLPRIDGISPERILIGTPVDVTISGTGLGRVTSIDAGTGITVSITSVSNAEIRARFNVDVNAPAGNHGVFAITSTGARSNGGNFFVQVPTSLRVLSQSIFSGGGLLANGCPTSSPFGFRVRVRYEVLDQSGNRIMITIPLRENLLDPRVDGQSAGGNNLDTFVTASGTTDSDGTFMDEPVGACATGPFNIASLTQELFTPLSANIRPIVRTNDFRFSGRNGCGNLTNGIDISVSVSCP